MDGLRGNEVGRNLNLVLYYIRKYSVVEGRDGVKRSGLVEG